MELISGKLLGYFRTCISLHSCNALVLLDLWNGARSRIKIYPSVGTQCIHNSQYFTVIIIEAIVLFGANKMRDIMLSVFRLL